MTYTTITPQRWQRLLLFAGLVAALGVEECNLNLVSIEGPADGTTFTEAQTVTITASALEGEGLTVGEVRFYRDDALAGTDRAAPYTHAWPITDRQDGIHRWHAAAVYRRPDGTNELLQSEEVVYEVAIAPSVPNPGGSVAQLTGFGRIHDTTLASGGEFVLVTSTALGLVAVDTRDPSRPSIVGRLDLEGEERGVAVHGSFAYVSSWVGTGQDTVLSVVDLRSLASLSLVGQLALPGVAAESVVVEDNTSYVTTGEGLFLVDVTNPRAPWLISHLKTRVPIGLSVDQRTVLLNIPEAFVTIDATDRHNPRIVSEVRLGWERHVLVDDLLFAIDKSSLWIMNYSNPDRPELLSRPLVRPRDLAVAGQHASVITKDSVVILNIADPRNPVVVEEVALATGPGIYGRSIAATGRLVVGGDSRGTLTVISLGR